MDSSKNSEREAEDQIYPRSSSFQDLSSIQIKHQEDSWLKIMSNQLLKGWRICSDFDNQEITMLLRYKIQGFQYFAKNIATGTQMCTKSELIEIYTKIKDIKTDLSRQQLETAYRQCLESGKPMNNMKFKMILEELEDQSHASMNLNYSDDSYYFGKGEGEDKKYPLLFQGLDQVKLRLELFDTLSSQTDDQQRLYSQLYTMSVSNQYQKIFAVAIDLLVGLIQNESNNFLSQYNKFMQEYQYYFEKRIEKNIFKQNKKFDMEQTKSILIEGIKGAKIIFVPCSKYQKIYGFNSQGIIYFNLASFFLNQISLKVGDQSIKLLTTFICLTVLHELAHYLIRFVLFKHNYKLKKSFIQQSALKSPHYNLFKESGSIIKFNHKSIDNQIQNFVIAYKEELYKIADRLLNKEKVNQNYECLKKQILGYLNCKIHQLLRGKNLENIVTHFQDEEIFKEVRKSVELRKDSERQCQVSRIFKIFLQNNLTEQTDNKTKEFIQAKISELQQDFLQQYLISYFRKSEIACSQVQFIQKYLTASEITLPSQTASSSKQQLEDFLIKMVNFKQYEGINFKKQFTDQFTTSTICAKQTFRIINQNNFLYLSDVLEDLNIASNLLANSKLIENIYETAHNLINLINICQGWRDYKNLLPIEKKKRMQSGWIMESNLFPNIHMNDNSSYISLVDLQLLQQLALPKKTQRQYEALRRNFGNQSFANFSKYDGPKIQVQRKGSNKSTSIQINRGPCYSWR